VDADVAELVRQERLLEAAALAAARGDPAHASRLYERACEWSRASAAALAAGEAGRALELAAQGDDEAAGEAAIAAIGASPRVAEACAAALSRKGLDGWAARALEAAGNAREAARAYERAGDAVRAGGLLEAAGDPAGAARVLEAALRRSPSAWGVAVALGGLLVRFGKHEAAVRTLQRVPARARERRRALVHLAGALAHLGLARAAEDAQAELATIGGAEGPASAAGESPQPAPVKARIFGRYDLVREVASSPSARVLECVDVVRGERVAVKVFAAWDTHGTGRDALARFEREVRAMRSLDHANVVPLRAYLPEGPAIVLGWMVGGTLERLLATTGALAPARAVEIAAAVLDALGEAHRLGILHRDVKPANVLFDEAGGARLSDFGVAHLGDLSTTATAGVFGTLAYMSPEQRAGRPATARSDVFAVGTMLREMLTGERPSPGEAPRVSPSAAHRELTTTHDAVVARLAATAPEDRPTDAFEARHALLALHWPSTVDTVAGRPRAERGSSAHPDAGRLAQDVNGEVLDAWTGRRVELAPLTESTLARARAFARADHAGLQPVLRVDRAAGSIWLGAVSRLPLGRPLAPAERATLEGALAALHGAGAVHGRVDAAHVALGESGAVLRFDGETDSTSSVDRDRLALSRI